MINARELSRQYELEPERCVAQLLENLDGGALKPEHFSIRDLFEATARDSAGNLAGRELLYVMQFRRSGGNRRALQEAANAVGTGDFSNITGQIIYNKIRERYAAPTFLWPQLCTTQMTEFLNGERIPGVGALGDFTQVVEEGQNYPTFGLNEEWTDTRPTVKHGGIVPVSREIVVADRTGLVLQLAGGVGEGAGYAKEKEVQDHATGVTSSYNRNGVSTNTYLTSGAYINSQTGNALDGSANEWRALEKAMLLFDSMTNPNTGEPMGIPAKLQLLVPTALLATANRIKHATSVETVDMRAQSTTIRTSGPNPYGSAVDILSNQYVKARSGSTTKWWFGDFAAAFLYMSVWEIEVLQAANNNEVEFTQDIWARHKVSYRGRVQGYEPRKVTQNDS